MDHELITLHSNYIKVYYEYFYQRYSGLKKPNLKYKFKPTERAEKFISEFLDIVGEDTLDSYGPTFYFNYFSFQWSYWENSEKIKSLSIVIDWIIDKKAYLRWNNRNTDHDYFLTEFQQKYGIKKSEILELVKIKEKSKVLKDSEEYNKAVFPNGHPDRLGYCYRTTTLYSVTSKICLKCKEKVDCKLLKEKLYAGKA